MLYKRERIKKLIMKRVEDMTKEEIIHCLNTVNDTKLQNEDNPYWWICFNIAEQKKLFDYPIKENI